MPEITDTIFRYREVSPTIFRYESQCQSPRIYFDSLSFQVDSGLTKWRWENCFEDDLAEGESFGTAQLISVIVTSADDQASLPARTRLLTNYPNPFNGTTTLTYELLQASQVILTIYDPNGRLIRSVDEGYRYPGRYSFQFKEAGLASGVYYVRLQTSNVVQSGRLIYLR